MIDPPNASPANTTPVFSGVVRRRWRLLISCVVLGLLLAAGYDYQRPPRYVATASVLVSPIDGGDSAQPQNGQRQRGPLNLATETQLVTSTAVAAAARSRLDDGQTVNQLIAAVDTKVPDGSSVIEISFEAATARAAQRGAEAFATAYLDHREQTAQRNLEQQVAAVQEQIAVVREELSEASAQVAAATPDSPEAILADAQADLLTSQLSSLSRTLGTLQATSTTPGRVINSAFGAAMSSGPGLPVLLAAGAALGLLLGCALALLRERTDRRVRSAGDVDNLVGLPVVSLAAGGRRRPLALVETHSSAAGQAFRRFRNTLLSSLPAGARLIVVTGAGPGHAARRVALNVAVALARGDCSVVFVDASTEPQRSRGGAVEPRPGLSDVLVGSHRLRDVLSVVDAIPNLRWLGPGRDKDGLTQQLQRRAAAATMAGLKESSDYVVVHAAPATGSPDAQTLARWADAGIVVVESGHTLGRQLSSAVDQFHEVRLTQLWVLLTRPQPRPGAKELASERSLLRGPDEPDEGGDESADDGVGVRADEPAANVAADGVEVRADDGDAAGADSLDEDLAAVLLREKPDEGAAAARNDLRPSVPEARRAEAGPARPG
jgi:capsular polysaccharide biosynthesis protein